MRLHRLELAGFGPFRERQVVDFDAFRDDGIFLITGRTGAGKSSILDGVCFALYGGVPRYEGGEKRLRSDHCAPEDPTEVSLEFSLGDARWRVTRSPEYDRPKRRGEGFTTEGAQARLEERVADGWVGRAAGPRDVGLALDEILGLTQQQFLQVILLAQNRFARFLLAGNAERQALLRTLFGTRGLEDYEKAFDARRREAEDAVEAGARDLEGLLTQGERLVLAAELRGDDEDAPGTSAERLAALDRAAQRARYRVETRAREQTEADAARRAAMEAHAAAETARNGQDERARLRTEVAALEADGPRIDAERAVRAAAARAEELRMPIERAAEAEAAAQIARAVRDAARGRWSDAGGEDGLEETELRAREESSTRELALWESALAQEREVAARREQLAAMREQIAAAETGLAELEVRRAVTADRLHALQDPLEKAAADAAPTARLETQLVEAEARLEAARTAERAAEALCAAEAAQLETGEALTRAGFALTTLLRRRLDGYAGELAAALVDGEPCAVCGALDHPAPAARTHDPVTDEQLAAAERAKDAAAEADATAGARTAAARAEHAAAIARSGGADPDTAAAALEASRAELDRATQAGRQREQLAAERDRLTAQAEADAGRRDALSRTVVEARVEEATLAEAVATAERAVAAARGEFGSVAERIAVTQRLRAAARELADAMAAVAVAETASATAGSDRDARVAQSGFADEAAVAAALRGDAERAELDARIRAHEDDLTGRRGALLQLELAGLPEDPVDTASALSTRDRADRAWQDAVASAADAATTARELAVVVERAGTALDAIGPLVADAEVIARLANTVAGRAPNTHRMTLETFVLAAELEEIVAQANVRLEEMSSGRYRLQHTDARAARNAASGLGIEVMDGYTGQARPAHSLSGGETFLASLALALGLAEVVTSRAGGIRLDTLFVDEGFGSLDAETLDVAMSTLDGLRQGGRTVGVISHVEVMKEQLPAQLVVEAGSHGPSVIRVPGVGAALVQTSR